MQRCIHVQPPLCRLLLLFGTGLPGSSLHLILGTPQDGQRQRGGVPAKRAHAGDAAQLPHTHGLSAGRGRAQGARLPCKRATCFIFNTWMTLLPAGQMAHTRTGCHMCWGLTLTSGHRVSLCVVVRNRHLRDASCFEMQSRVCALAMTG